MGARSLYLRASPVAWTVLAFGAFALLAACGSTGPSGARSSPGASQTAGPGSGDQACQGSDLAAAIRAASAAQNSASSYQIDTISTTQRGNSHLTLQVQQPDRFHFTTVEPDGHTIEYVAIGANTWTRSNGSWAAAPGLNLGSLVKQAGPLNEILLDGTTLTQVSIEPHASLSGQSAVLDKFHMSIASANLNADVQLWLASENCRPLRAISSFSTAVNGVTSTGRSTTNWSAWNTVSIEPPA